MKQKTKRVKKIKQKHGSALIFATIILFSLLAITVTLSAITVSDMKMSQKTKSSTGAFFDSDSGVEWALNKIASSSSGLAIGDATTFDDSSLGDGVDCPFGGCKLYFLDAAGTVITDGTTKKLSDIKAVRSVGTQGAETQRAIEAVIPPACGSYSVTGSDGLTYDTVKAADGKCWLDRNLGATQVATSSGDADSYGYYYQWGRDSDGHQIGTSGITDELSSSNTPGHSNFIITVVNPFDWLSLKNDDLWQGALSVNNPCPSGFRLPTGGVGGEWSTLVTAESITSPETAFSSSLKLPLAGYRDFSDGGIYGLADEVYPYGCYWSSSPDNANAYYFLFMPRWADSNGIHEFPFIDPANYDYRSDGLSVRCVKG